MEREEEGEGVEQREEEGEGRRGDNASLPPAFSGTLWWVTYNTAETDEHLEEHGAHGGLVDIHSISSVRSRVHIRLLLLCW
jgi:hypothetical protein